jgi:signal transduction histidine kinase
MTLTWKTKLYLFAAIITVLPAAFLSFNMINITRDELKDSRNTELNNLTDQLASQINTLYKNNWLEPLLYVNSGLENENLGANEKMSYLSALVENSDRIISLSLFFKKGQDGYSEAIQLSKGSYLSQLKEKNLDPKTTLGFSNSDIQSLKNSNNIGEPYYLNEIDVWVLNMMIPIKISGAPESFLCAKINLNDLRKTIESNNFNERGNLMLVNKKGEIIFGNKNSDIHVEGAIDEAVRLLNSGSRMNFNNSYESSAGEKVLVYCAFPLNLEWAVIAELSESKAYGAVAQMQNRMYLWIAASLIIALLVMLVFSRQISKPILRISDLADVISDGNFDVSFDYKAKDEIGKLGETLVRMAQSLKASFAKIAEQNKELEDYSHNLEAMVEERTKQLKDAQQQLIIQEKLASLGSLTAGIAHEIQNPLNFINNFSKLSIGLTDELIEEINNYRDKIDKEDYELIDEILEDLRSNTQKINEHGGRAERIVKGMLEHSRGEAGEMREIDINLMLKESMNLAYHGFRNENEEFNIKMIENLDESIGKVFVDSQSLNRVFLNIINNAFYATFQKKKEEGGAYNPEFSISTKLIDNKIEIRLRDNGAGIPEDVRQKIFEPFFTTKPTGEGTGLGLSLSHDIIVQMHKGELNVESETGKYTEFILTIPTDLKK